MGEKVIEIIKKWNNVCNQSMRDITTNWNFQAKRHSLQEAKFLKIINLFSKYAQSFLVNDGKALTFHDKLRQEFNPEDYWVHSVESSSIKPHSTTIIQFSKMLRKQF